MLTPCSLCHNMVESSVLAFASISFSSCLLPSTHILQNFSAQSIKRSARGLIEERKKQNVIPCRGLAYGEAIFQNQLPSSDSAWIAGYFCSNTILPFFLFFIFLQINCSDQAETLLNGFLLLAQRFEWTHNQSATNLKNNWSFLHENQEQPTKKYLEQNMKTKQKPRNYLLKP